MLAQYHMFEHERNTYLLHIEDMKAYKIDDALGAEISRIARLGGDWNPDADSPLSTALRRLNLLDCVPPKKRAAVPPRVPVTHISLNISQSCNMDCIYCYGTGGEYGRKGNMKLDIAKAAVDWLIRKSENSKSIVVTFFGGEPILNLGVMKKVVTYARDKARAAGKSVLFSLTTNGTLLTPDVKNYLNENRISVVVSYDGDRTMMEHNRPLKRRDISYDELERRVRSFVESRKGNVTARATITRYNADLVRVKESLVGLGFKRIRPVEAAERITNGGPGSPDNEQNHFTLEADQRETLQAQLDDAAQSLVDSIKNDGIITDDELLSYMCRLHLRSKRYYFCGVGKGLVGISLSGDVYPCHRFVGVEWMKMGHVDDTLGELKQEDYISNFGITHPSCSDCWARYFCGGGCIYEHMQGSRTMERPWENSCRRIRRQVELAIASYAMLNDRDRQVVNRYATRDRKNPENQPRS